MMLNLFFSSLFNIITLENGVSLYYATSVSDDVSVDINKEKIKLFLNSFREGDVFEDDSVELIYDMLFKALSSNVEYITKDSIGWNHAFFSGVTI